MTADATAKLPQPKVGRWQRLHAKDAVRVLVMWIAIRTGVWLWMLGAAWLSGAEAGLRASDPYGWFFARFVAWDSTHFLRIAEHGYNAGKTCCDQVFFPGYPMTIRVLTPMFGDVRIAALVVPVVAGTVAAMLLWRITSEEFGTVAGRHAVALLALTPYGVFLSVAYSESLFLALTLAAWYFARHQRWWWAGVAASGAALVRVNGVFVAVALVVLWFTARKRESHASPAAALALLMPFASAAAFAWYIRSRSWLSWPEAQDFAWGRHLAWPWEGVARSWGWVTAGASFDLRLSGAVELLVILLGVALVVMLARRRRWAEGVYVGLSVGVLLFSNSFLSSPRFSVLWFPAFVLGGAWLGRKRSQTLNRWAYTASIMGLAVTSWGFAVPLWVS